MLNTYIPTALDTFLAPTRIMLGDDACMYLPVPNLFDDYEKSREEREEAARDLAKWDSLSDEEKEQTAEEVAEIRDRIAAEDK